METEKILAGIGNADMVLVGMGEDFDDGKRLQGCPGYAEGKQYLRDTGQHWLIPLWNEYCSAGMGEDVVSPVLEKLAGILAGKNYFVVATATDSRIFKAPWKQGRLVMPCGTTLKKQCTGGCGLEEVSEEERKRLNSFFEELSAASLQKADLREAGLQKAGLREAGFQKADLREAGLQQTGFLGGGRGKLTECRHCGRDMVLNTVYAEAYDEQGYLEQWQTYMKWLQGTINRRLVVMELGVGMRFPSVIRWPFEKAAYFNQKAFFIRVNERLYQMTEELSGKGCSIPKNAIAWLERL